MSRFPIFGVTLATGAAALHAASGSFRRSGAAVLGRPVVRMLVTLLAAAVACTACDASPQPSAPSATPLTFKAADGVTVHALYYQSKHPKALILLFHQAGSGKGEYATIAPRLVASGYSALAVDQRSGGAMFGPNETVAALGQSAGYDDAKRDLEAALAWSSRIKLPVILLGSSYSGALVSQIAAEHPEAKAVLAFSPGEFLGDRTAVRAAAARVMVPIYVTSSADPNEMAAARAILAASPARVKVQYLPQSGGVHGASTLIAERNPRGAAANWQAMLAFLSDID